MSKAALRAEFLRRRSALDAEFSRQQSALIQAQVLALAEFATAGIVALYAPTRGEALTEEIGHVARQQGKTTVYPRVIDHGLEFVAATGPEALTRCRYGICAPQSGPIIDLSMIDLLVLPGVAFDRRGMRLGYGKGYYDRALVGRRPRTVLVGLAYDFQLVEELPAETHDVPLDIVVTAGEMLRFPRAASGDAPIPAC